MPEEPLFTLRQLAGELNLPESTIRYYRDLYLDHIPSVGTGRRRRYPHQAAAVLATIARGYAAGRSRREIVMELGGQDATGARATEPPPVRLAVEEVTNLDLLAAILDGEREQRDALWQMAREIVRLTEVLDGQDRVLTEIATKAGVSVGPALSARPAPASLAAPAGPQDRSPPTPQAPPAPEVPKPPAPDDSSRAGHGPGVPESPPSAVASQPLPLASASQVGQGTSPPAPAPAPPAWSSPASGAESDAARLREELEAERALVERLREAKLRLEHRAADAEAALEEAQRRRRSSMIRRLLGEGPAE